MESILKQTYTSEWPVAVEASNGASLTEPTTNGNTVNEARSERVTRPKYPQTKPIQRY
jgi:hypothetical protein